MLHKSYKTIFEFSRPNKCIQKTFACYFGIEPTISQYILFQIYLLMIGFGDIGLDVRINDQRIEFLECPHIWWCHNFLEISDRYTRTQFRSYPGIDMIVILWNQRDSFLWEMVLYLRAIFHIESEYWRNSATVTAQKKYFIWNYCVLGRTSSWKCWLRPA